MKTILAISLAFLLWAAAMPAWAAICYVGGQTGSFAGTTSNQAVNFALSGGDVGCANAAPQTDDLAIVTWGISATADFALVIHDETATQYTLLGTESYVSDLYDTNRRSAYRVMPGPTETSFLLGVSSPAGTGSTANAGAYTVHVFRGVHATPLEQAVVQNSGTNTSNVNPSAITPSTAGTVVYVAGVGALATGRQGVYTSSDLTAFLSSAQDDTNAVNIGAGYFAWTSGAFDPAQFGDGGTDNAEHSFSFAVVALAPAAEAAASVSQSNSGACLVLGVRGC